MEKNKNIRMQNDFPTRKELEQDLAQLRDVSASIDKVTKTMADEDQRSVHINRIFEDHLINQREIVDKFIGLCDDRNALQDFTRIVNNIRVKTELLKSITEEESYNKLKKQILHHIEEWADCLEKIIIGVMNQTVK